MIKSESELSAFMVWRALVCINYGGPILSSMNFPFLCVAIQKKSFITNYEHIYIVPYVKSPKSCSRNNL